MDSTTLLAQIMLRLLDFELTKEQAALEGRGLNEAEIDKFRQQLITHESDLEAAIAQAKAEGR